MATTTPIASIPVPTSDDDPDIPDDMTKMANAIERKLVNTYASISDRDSRLAAPESGMLAFMKDTSKLLAYFNGEWNQIYPLAGPQITSGTSAPNNATGTNGDVYFQV